MEISSHLRLRDEYQFMKGLAYCIELETNLSVSGHRFSNALVGIPPILNKSLIFHSSSVNIRQLYPSSFIQYFSSHIIHKAFTYFIPFLRSS